MMMIIAAASKEPTTLGARLSEGLACVCTSVLVVVSSSRVYSFAVEPTLDSTKRHDRVAACYARAEVRLEQLERQQRFEVVE